MTRFAAVVELIARCRTLDGGPDMLTLPAESYQLDMTPDTIRDNNGRCSGTAGDFEDAGLPAGRTFINPLGHLRITVNWADTTGASISVSPV
jgi:hypothetical protein